MKLFPVDGLPSPPSATQAFQPVKTSEAHIPSNNKSHFPFLLLPPEIRNQIYRYLVHVREQKLIVRDVLQHAWNPELKRSTYMLEYDQETKGRRSSFTYLTTYRCSNCDWDKRRWIDNHFRNPGPRPRRRGDPPVEVYEWEEPPHLNIVLANRQLHREAQSIFHEQQFCLDMSARGALAFLRDRSETAISQIQRVGIRYNGINVYSNGEYLKKTDGTSWVDLCRFFRENMRLKELHLYLGCSVWGGDSVVQRTAYPAIKWNCLNESAKRAFEHLGMVGGLEKLRLLMYEEYYCFFFGDDSELADELQAFLQSRMLRDGGRLIGWRTGGRYSRMNH